MADFNPDDQPMLRLVVVDHSFVEATHRKRWRILAEEYPVEVTLLVPETWRLRVAGSTEMFHPDPVEDGRYRVVPLPTTSERDWMKYLFLSLDAKIRSLDPDLIHVQHSEMTLVNHQMILYRRLWAPDADVTFFTMNALGVPRGKWHQRLRWKHLKGNASAALCHYPGCRDSLRDAGFRKPIYVQTSYGVDEDIFHPDPETRERIRKELGFEDRFVVGYVGRLTRDKGVDDLLKAMPVPEVDWGLLLVGGGEMRGRIEDTVREEGWDDRVETTGFVPKAEVARYLQAMDCFVLGSKTRDHWIDTFPRSIVEAMACGVPVIGSNSGAIPFQIQDAGLIFSESDVAELRKRLRWLAADDSLRERLAERGRERSIERFGQRALADNFYKILQQIHTDEVEYSDGDESVQHRAY